MSIVEVLRLALALASVVGVATVAAVELVVDDPPPAGAKGSATWKLSIPAGQGRFQENCGEGQWPMAIVPLAGIDEKLWMVGRKTAWSSADGIHWSAHPKTDWGERAGEALASFAGKLWMLGGMRTWDDFKSDVWCSNDGTEWKQVTERAEWPARRGHAVAVFDGRLWVLGGARSSGRADQVPTSFFNDVWSSDDGVRWTQECSAAPWAEREGHAGLVFDGKLLIVGGTGLRDVWQSVNGRDWTTTTSEAEWPARHSNGAAVLGGKLWVFGGRGLNDVWSSADGAHWQQSTDHAPWSPRTTIHSVVFDDGLWIYGGKTGREDSWDGDVWTMTEAQ